MKFPTYGLECQTILINLTQCKDIDLIRLVRTLAKTVFLPWCYTRDGEVFDQLRDLVSKLGHPSTFFFYMLHITHHIADLMAESV